MDAVLQTVPNAVWAVVQRATVNLFFHTVCLMASSTSLLLSLGTIIKKTNHGYMCASTVTPRHNVITEVAMLDKGVAPIMGRTEQDSVRFYHATKIGIGSLK